MTHNRFSAEGSHFSPPRLRARLAQTKGKRAFGHAISMMGIVCGQAATAATRSRTAAGTDSGGSGGIAAIGLFCPGGIGGRGGDGADSSSRFLRGLRRDPANGCSDDEETTCAQGQREQRSVLISARHDQTPDQRCYRTDHEPDRGPTKRMHAGPIVAVVLEFLSVQSSGRSSSAGSAPAARTCARRVQRRKEKKNSNSPAGELARFRSSSGGPGRVRRWRRRP